MADIQTILNSIDERLRKKHKPDSELWKKHNADFPNRD